MGTLGKPQSNEGALPRAGGLGLGPHGPLRAEQTGCLSIQVASLTTPPCVGGPILSLLQGTEVTQECAGRKVSRARSPGASSPWGSPRPQSAWQHLLGEGLRPESLFRQGNAWEAGSGSGLGSLGGR